ncbi:MAG: hypothetical protein HQL53_05530 [Magnetococcales bacterium]|nr:hypothetical protein [Magnetococcales bacterium]
MKRMKVILFGAIAGCAMLTLPLDGWAYKTDECGPMCHTPNVQKPHPGGYASLGSRTGSFYDMKQRFHITPAQEEAWNRFQVAVLTRLSRAFDTENIAFDRSQLTKTPKDYNEETFEPALSDEQIKNWNAVLKEFQALRTVLDDDHKKAVDRIRSICKVVK